MSSDLLLGRSQLNVGLAEKKVDGCELFHGHFLHAFQDQVRLPDGESATREYVVHPGAVMIIPLLEEPQGIVQVVLERKRPANTPLTQHCPDGRAQAGVTA